MINQSLFIVSNTCFIKFEFTVSTLHPVVGQMRGIRKMKICLNLWLGSVDGREEIERMELMRSYVK